MDSRTRRACAQLGAEATQPSSGRPLITTLIQKLVYGHGVYFTGSAEELIEAGICTDDQIPGRPGRNKMSITHKRGRETVWSIKVLPRGQLRFYVSRHELKARTAGFGEFMAAVLRPVSLTEVDHG